MIWALLARCLEPLLMHCRCIAGPPRLRCLPAPRLAFVDAVPLFLPHRLQSGISPLSVRSKRKLGKNCCREFAAGQSVERAPVVWQSIHQPLMRHQADIHAALCCVHGYGASNEPLRVEIVPRRGFMLIVCHVKKKPRHRGVPFLGGVEANCLRRKNRTPTRLSLYVA
jgi:hypothetical protein